MDFPYLEKSPEEIRHPQSSDQQEFIRPSRNRCTPIIGQKKIYNFSLRHYFKTATTGAFSDFRTFYECATLGQLKHKYVEVMVHPGQTGYEGAQAETELLQTSWETDLMFPVRLVSYNELPF